MKFQHSDTFSVWNRWSELRRGAQQKNLAFNSVIRTSVGGIKPVSKFRDDTERGRSEKCSWNLVMFLLQCFSFRFVERWRNEEMLDSDIDYSLFMV